MEVKTHNIFNDDIDLFKSKPCSDLYPRKDYSLRPAFYFHFLIALGQPLITIATRAQTLKEKNPNWLLQGDPQNFQLTPLHIAAIKGQLAVAEVLLKTCENANEKMKMINTPDALGWTSLHFAAVTSNSLFKYLVNLGGDPAKKSTKGADCNDLLQLTGRAIDIRSSKTLFVQDEECKSLVLLSDMANSAKEKIFGKGFVFTDSSPYSKERFQEIWLNNEEEGSPEQKRFLPQLYANLRKNPVPLLIGQCEELKSMTPLSFECKAKEKILCGSLISEYSGIRESFPPVKTLAASFSENEIFISEYYLDGINSRKAGNETRFYNTGFPNAILIDTIERGVKRLLLQSIRDIQPGESILWDYGIAMHHLSFGVSKILGKEKMISFFQENKENFLDLTLKACFDYSEVQNLENFIRKAQFEAPVYFALNSPTALLYLHFNELVKHSVWKMEFDQHPTITSWREKHSYESVCVSCMFEILDKLENFCSNNEIKQRVNQWALQKLEKESVINILKGLDLLILKQGIKNSEKLEAALKEIDLFLINYDWKNDLSKSPFNMERKVRIMLKFYKQYPKKELKEALTNQIQLIGNKQDESYQLNELILKKL
ncbi:MAG: ankyrin repeat domain-containing protein [Candidatus Protochlamydia sp.]|nr:ankyrin repeat domain-containing protein [Candidatus Protochlamydia sp.]